MNKIQYITFFSLLAILMAGAGCSKSTGEIKTHKVYLSAVVGDDPDLRSEVTDAGVFSWSEGDQIGVWTSDNRFTPFTLESGSGTASATFVANLGDNVEVVAGPVVFPYDSHHSFNQAGNSVSFYLNSTTSVSWEEGKVKSAMIANYSGSGTISLKQIGGLFRVTIYGIPSTIRYVRFSSNNSKVNGNFDVDLSSGEPAITAPTSSERSDITFSLNPSGESGHSYTFDFPVPTGNFNNIRIATYDSNWNISWSKTSTSDKNIGRGTMMLMPDLFLATTYLMENFEDNENNEIPGSLTGDNSYTNQYGSPLSIVANPKKTHANTSNYVLKDDMHNWGDATGYAKLDTHKSLYSSIENFRNGSTGFRMKILYNNPAEAQMYYPHATVQGATPEEASKKRLPDLVNGKPFNGTSVSWVKLINPDDWNVLQWSGDCSVAYTVELRPLLAFDGTQKKEGSKIIYIDDFEYIK